MVVAGDCHSVMIHTQEWEKLASALKGQVKIAYWDTEQKGRRPPLLGEIRGTPTIRFFTPHRRQKIGSNDNKNVKDYREDRKLLKMYEYVVANMPDYVELVSYPGNYAKKVQPLAEKYGLPQAVFFSTKSKTNTSLKFLSAKFRRRILVVQVPYKKQQNRDLMKEFGITQEDLPALVVVKADGKEKIRYESLDFKRHKMERVFEEHANKEETYHPVKKDTPKEEEDEKQKARVEL